uniref:ribosomal protein S17 n=1 Tax=Stylonema alsidii TaxID=35155 RepID=UPI001FCDB01A|nr:ribosomal protein S17 [Stylonema alsidii]UNJ15163.1 ribosomal protein S17 [Stylonema alsidii]
MATKERVGIVVSNKMCKTLVIAVESRVLHPKYKKIMVRTKRYKAHVEQESNYKLGDTVRIQETRPLSRTKRWQVIDIISKSPR